jgi:hypothetical protein
MPPKKYQSIDDPDSDEEPQPQVEQLEEKLLPPPVERSDEKPKDLPKRVDGKRLIDKQALLEAIENNVITLNRSQQRKLLPKVAPIQPPRPKRVITAEQRERLMKQLAKAHETNRQKKLLKQEEQVSLKEKHKHYIEKNMIAIEDKTIRGKKAPPQPKKKVVEEKKEEQEQEQEQEQVKRPKTKPKREYVEPNNYPSDDETEGDTTDTRTIKRVNKKLKMVRKPLQQQQPQNVEYKDLSLLEKLNLRL